MTQQEKKSVIAKNHPTDGFVSAFHFKVSFLELDAGNAFFTVGFSEVSGLDLELQTEDIVNAGENQYVYHLPKPAKTKNLVLKHAFGTFSPEFFNRIDKAINMFEFKLFNVAVELLNEEHKTIKSWFFHEAYPVKLSYTNLDASKNEIVVETLEIAYKYMRFK